MKKEKIIEVHCCDICGGEIDEYADIWESIMCNGESIYSWRINSDLDVCFDCGNKMKYLVKDFPSEFKRDTYDPELTEEQKERFIKYIKNCIDKDIRNSY